MVQGGKKEKEKNKSEVSKILEENDSNKEKPPSENNKTKQINYNTTLDNKRKYFFTKWKKNENKKKQILSTTPLLNFQQLLS